jgi:hypothetical protein
MKYLILFIVLVLAWKLVEELVFAKGSSREDLSFGERLRELGSRTHETVGMVAILIIVIFLARLIFRALFSD